MTGGEAERVARESYGKLVALLAVEFRDVAAAEDALSDALLAALTRWPEQGVPDSPEGWLVTVARRKLIDQARRNRATPLQDVSASRTPLDPFRELDSAIPDRRLALFFVCAHPAIDPSARTPMILQTVLGFDAQRIAQAFLTSHTSMSQRLVRAKKKIREDRIPFEVPGKHELPERLDAVLNAVYACYEVDSERAGSAEEAIWLARLLVELCPEEPETAGLLALLLHAEARKDAGRSKPPTHYPLPTPHFPLEYIPLDQQDPRDWNAPLIDEAEQLLYRAVTRGKAGRFQLEAAVQSAHAARRLTGTTDWNSILTLYDALMICAPSPVVTINRAIAVMEVHGAVAGLKELDQVGDDPRVRSYQPYWAARADVLRRLGDKVNARVAYHQAIGLTKDAAVRRFLMHRLEGEEL